MKRTLHILHDNFKRNIDLRTRAIDEPVKLVFDIFLLVAFVVTFITSIVFSTKQGAGQSEFFLNVLVESYGLVFNLLIVGCLLLWLSKFTERRLEIKKYKNEIDDFRFIKNTVEIKARIMGNIRRLNNLGITNINLSMCDLDHQQFLQNSDEQANKYPQEQKNLYPLNLNRANFLGTSLSKSLFTYTSLSNASFKHANLTDATFMRTNLLNANFESADVTGAHFIEVYFLKTVDFTNTKGLDQASGIPPEIIYKYKDVP